MSSQKLEAQGKARLQASIDALERTQSTLKDYSWLSLARPPPRPARARRRRPPSRRRRLAVGRRQAAPGGMLRAPSRAC
jgi:hypothetical protein